MLEGKEFEGKLGDVGNYNIDVDEKGVIKIVAVVSKDLGHSKLSNSLSIETNIFEIASVIAKKTATDLDDKAIEVLKSILGIKEESTVLSSGDIKS
jgi:hypothetical protein